MYYYPKGCLLGTSLSFNNRKLDLSQLLFCGTVKAGIGYPVSSNIPYSIWQQSEPKEKKKSSYLFSLWLCILVNNTVHTGPGILSDIRSNSLYTDTREATES